MDFSNLRKLRESLGLSQKDFAASLGCNQTTYNNYENGLRDPKSDFWEKVAKTYSVSTDYLLGLSDTPFIQKQGETHSEKPQYVQNCVINQSLTALDQTIIERLFNLDSSQPASLTERIFSLIKYIQEDNEEASEEYSDWYRAHYAEEVAAFSDRTSSILSLQGLLPHIPDDEDDSE